MNLAIITARGGSKRIPKKNIREFCGKSIIAYSIEAAMKSNCFDIVMVSTDNNEVADVAKNFGAEVPFLRSPKNSGDYSTTAEVILEVLQCYKEHEVNFDFVCCIYPTAPFITADNLNKTLELIQRNEKINSVFPVILFSYPIQRALKLKDDFISMIQPDYILTRSQDCAPSYHDAGQFYWLRVNEFIKNPTLFPEFTATIVLQEWQAQDIDNEFD